MDGSKSEGGYWEKRRLALLQQMERDEAKLNDKLARTYQTEIARLDREIASYYQRYGEDNVIEYRKLLTTLSAEDRTLLIERMDEFGKKYPEYAHLLPVRESIYKLNEMEGIQLSMRMQQLEIGAVEQEALQRHLEKQALRSANLAAEQMGFGKDFYTYDASVVKATVGKAWANEQSFRERIWGNRQKLASYLNDDFAKAVARGASYEQVMKELGTRFENVSKRDMRRLVFTEGTFVFNEAHAQTHEQMFEHYTLSTASDSGVCKQCLGAEAQTRKEPVLFKDRSPGINFPPLHPGCRCSYEIAVDDWDAWVEKQVAKGGGDSLQKQVRTDSSAKMSGEGIRWPEHGSKMARKDYVAVRSLAEEAGVVLEGFRNSDASVEAIEAMVLAIGAVRARSPKISAAIGPSVGLVNSGMHPADFSEIYPDNPEVIRVNHKAMRDYSALKKEYADLAEQGYYVKGTTAEAIMFHELGHVVLLRGNIDPKEIIEEVYGSSGALAREHVKRNLSKYAAKYGDFRELVSEAFSAYYSNVGNEFAERIVEALERRLS